MAIDIAVLTTTIVSSFLVPYLKLGAEKLVEEVGKTFGKSAGKHTLEVSKRIWKSIKTKFNSKDNKVILKHFEKSPEEASKLIEKLLKEMLLSDIDYANELNDLINLPSPDGQGTGAQIMQAHIAGIVDLRNADFRGTKDVSIKGVSITKHEADEEDK